MGQYIVHHIHASNEKVCIIVATIFFCVIFAINTIRIFKQKNHPTKKSNPDSASGFVFGAKFKKKTEKEQAIKNQLQFFCQFLCNLTLMLYSLHSSVRHIFFQTGPLTILAH